MSRVITTSLVKFFSTKIKETIAPKKVNSPSTLSSVCAVMLWFLLVAVQL